MRPLVSKFIRSVLKIPMVFSRLIHALIVITIPERVVVYSIVVGDKAFNFLKTHINPEYNVS